MFNVGVARAGFAMRVDLILVAVLVVLLGFFCFKAGQRTKE